MDNNLTNTTNSINMHPKELQQFPQPLFGLLVAGASVDVLTVFVAVFNTRVILRTPILHPNLRLVLGVQCSAVALLAATDLAINVCKCTTGSPLGMGPSWLAALYTFTLQVTILLGHVLLVERAMATIWVARYERFTAPYFSIVWITILTVICGTNSGMFYASMEAKKGVMISNFNLVINYLALLLSFAEIIVVARLGLYNAAKFTQSAFYRGNVVRRLNTLSERYQLSENARTLRQLGPTFVAHFVVMLCTNASLNSKFFPLSVIACVVVGSLFVMSLANLAMVVAVLEFHPALRLCFRRVLLRLFCINFWRQWRTRTGTTQNAGNNFVTIYQHQHQNPINPVTTSDANGEEIRRRHSSTVITISLKGAKRVESMEANLPRVFPLWAQNNAEQDRHFEMLKQSWA